MNTHVEELRKIQELLRPEDVTITTLADTRGGQYAGSRPIGLTVTHNLSGVSVTIPPDAMPRSQHKGRTAAMEALEYALLGIGWFP